MRRNSIIPISTLIAAPLLSAMIFIMVPQDGRAFETQSDNDSTKSESAKTEKSKEGDFARGAKLWADRCSSCHNMRDPKDLTDSEWEATVTHMRIRAGLSGQDARDILAFLQKSN
jgi:cytochrome c1